MNYGLYIHFPFCRSKCDYCAFFSVPIEKDGNDLIESYLSKLKYDIESTLIKFCDDTVDTIYIGGGTPSILNPEQVHELLNIVDSSISVHENAEVSIEINPEDVSIDKITGFKDAGINRMTLGVQTLNRGLHSLIGRSSKICSNIIFDDFFKIDGFIKCIDLITGIPNQKKSDLRKDIDLIADRKPEHVSVYSLSLESGTPLCGRMENDLSFEENQRMLFNETISAFLEKGYNHYEISNFSIHGYESRHNMKYWKFDPYIGIGAGAHSFYHDERSYNQMSVEDYIMKEIKIVKDRRSETSAMAEYIFTGMRLIRGISVKEFESRLNCKFPVQVMNNIIKFSEEGLVQIDRSREDFVVRLKRDNLVLGDSIIYKIVEPLI